MQSEWLKNLKLNYSTDVIDIVQFGSSVIIGSDPNDIDVAVIFKKIPARSQLSQAQDIKKQIQNTSELKVHVKAFDLYSFFEKSNFARDDILFYGKSIIYGKVFAENFGLSPKVQVFYSLENLEKREKVKFNYLLNGKGGKYGLLKKHGGKIVAPGVVEFKPEHEKVFLDAMKKITNDVKVRRVFEVI